ncbi:MAG: hypothetical protein QOE70_5500 [Chthoniobacter sp.]|jgi:hypothetical protein|nr:hypothetical protein [Chthoniobacter sp.]
MKVKWDEPVEFIRAYLQSVAPITRRSRVWAAIGTAVVVDVLILAFWGFFYLLHKKDLGVPTYTYFVAPALAGLFVYFLPDMIASSRCVIVLTEKGIHRHKNFGSEIHMQLWPWESITELAVEEVRLGETVHRVLVVRSSLEQGDTMLGLGNTPLEPIEDAITRMGKTLVYR